MVAAPAVLVVTTVALAAMTAAARVRVDVVLAVQEAPAVLAFVVPEALLACAAARALPAVIAAPVATAHPAMTSVAVRENSAVMAKDHRVVVAAAMTVEAPVSAVLMTVPPSCHPPAAGWRPFCLNPQASKT